MALTQARLTQSGLMRGLQAASNRVLQNYTSGAPPASPYVGYRTFDATKTNKVVVSVGESTAQTFDTYSQFALVRATALGGGVSYTWFTAARADGNRACYWYLNWDSRQETDVINQIYTSGGPQIPVGQWALVGITKPPGTVQPTYHTYLFATQTWYHDLGGNLHGTAAMGAGGEWYLGHDKGGDEAWYGDIAAEVFFDKVLTTPQVESLSKGLSKWTGLGPVHCWRLDQTTVNDLVGSADQVTVVGAPIAADLYSPLLVTAPVVVYSDDFNRANAALAAPWVNAEGIHSISGNKVIVGTASPTVSYYNQIFAADQWAEGDVAGWVEGGSSFGPVVRINGSDFVYMFFSNSPARVAIWKRVGGTYTQVAASGSAAPTTTFKARLEVEGTTYRAYIDGVLTATGTATDTGIATGQPGILSANGGAATLDNWRGGDLPYSAPIYTDNFNRADSGNLGADWTQTNAQIYIKDGHLWMNTSGCSNAYTAVTFPPTSHWAEAKMRIQDGQEGSIGPSVRQGSGENSYYAWIRGPNNPPTFEIWRQWLGTYTQIGGYAIPVPAAKTGPVRVAIDVDGLIIRGYIEGVKVIEWTEDNPGAGPTGAYPGVNGGLFGASQDPVQCDDFRCGPGRYPG
jgi:hypothetical protein